MKTEPVMPVQHPKGLLKTLVIRFIGVFVVMSAIVLLPAGTLHFWQFYLYTTILFGSAIFVLLYFWQRDPKFLERRMKTKEQEKPQQLIVLSTLVPFLVGYALCGLDARFHWSQISMFTVLAANLMVLLSYLFVIYVFKENSFASRVVEVSQEQTVISTGPYSLVRHPMYLGITFMYLATPIALGSYWALIPFVTLPVALVFRILNEEKLLSKNLFGYIEYCQKVKYRLFPFIW